MIADQAQGEIEVFSFSGFFSCSIESSPFFSDQRSISKLKIETRRDKKKMVFMTTF